MSQFSLKPQLSVMLCVGQNHFIRIQNDGNSEVDLSSIFQPLSACVESAY